VREWVCLCVGYMCVSPQNLPLRIPPVWERERECVCVGESQRAFVCVCEKIESVCERGRDNVFLCV